MTPALSELLYRYASTLMAWQAVGPDPAAWDHLQIKKPADAFTTLHPGLFAGGGGGSGGAADAVLFDYFNFTDHEVFPVDEA